MKLLAMVSAFVVSSPEEVKNIIEGIKWQEKKQKEILWETDNFDSKNVAYYFESEIQIFDEFENKNKVTKNDFYIYKLQWM